MEKKQTAVEWLQEQFDRQRFIEKLDFETAKQMEKDQIIDATADHCYPTCELARVDAEQYYQETYGGGNNE
jgi:hypothetical protein